MSLFFSSIHRREKKGNKVKNGLNSTGKDFIIKKFEEKFGERHPWSRFKNKYDTCRRIYVKVKKLIHNRTGLGYDALGRLEMSDDWWDQRIEEWPEAKKYKNNLIPNIDVFEEEFGAVTVTGAEGWCAQQGEASLDSRLGENNEDEYESVDTDMPVPMVETQSKARGSRSKRKRKEADLITEISTTRNALISQKNKLLEQMLERDYNYSVEHVVEILNGLPGVRKWSPFHRASVDHLLADSVNKQGFIAFSSIEDKITYLEHRTGRKVDD